MYFRARDYNIVLGSDLSPTPESRIDDSGALPTNSSISISSLPQVNKALEIFEHLVATEGLYVLSRLS